MAKKNDKRLCWNCDGGVSPHLTHCPYCGVDVTQDGRAKKGGESPPQGLFHPSHGATPVDGGIPKSPYADLFGQESSGENEWDLSLDGEKEAPQEEEQGLVAKREMIALLLLLPGAVFFLFGLMLVFFSSDGVLTLEWNQRLAYFYFLGALPLLYLGWRAFR